MDIGLISDTHGLLRPEALKALKGNDLILHAGDIGKPEVLEGLTAIAPVIAVRGNNDKGAWAEAIAQAETIQADQISIHMLHIVQELKLDLKNAGVRVVISGHSHKPAIAERDDILFINPGSAGPRRFKLPVSVARLRVSGITVTASIVELTV